MFWFCILVLIVVRAEECTPDGFEVDPHGREFCALVVPEYCCTTVLDEIMDEILGLDGDVEAQDLTGLTVSDVCSCRCQNAIKTLESEIAASGKASCQTLRSSGEIIEGGKNCYCNGALCSKVYCHVGGCSDIRKGNGESGARGQDASVVKQMQSLYSNKTNLPNRRTKLPNNNTRLRKKITRIFRKSKKNFGGSKKKLPIRRTREEAEIGDLENEPADNFSLITDSSYFNLFNIGILIFGVICGTLIMKFFIRQVKDEKQYVPLDEEL